jgi:hypothetical protein
MKPPNEVFQKASLFKSLWEQRYPNEVYVLVPMVFKWAKELIDVDNDLIVERFKIFASDEWYGENTRHSLQSFVKNFNSFVPKTRRKDGTWKREEPMPMDAVAKLFQPIADAVAVEKKATDPNAKYTCPKCHKMHSPNYQCEV